MNPRNRPSVHNEQGKMTCLVLVDISPQNEQRDHVSNLLLKQAKEALKDALLACAERHDGKLDSWKDHSGTFVFPADGPDDYNNCCAAAVRMLDELASVTHKDLVTIRIVCDAGMFLRSSETHKLLDEVMETFKKHGLLMSANNRVTITERVFHKLREPLKSRFQKSKRSAELGIDSYTNIDRSVGLAPTPADTQEETGSPVPEQTMQAASEPVGGGRASQDPEFMPGSLRSRPAFAFAAGIVLCLSIFALVRFWPTAPPSAAPSAVVPTQYQELVQSDAWRNWRKQIQEKLSGDKITEGMIADALKLELPARSEHAGPALRRDQAIGEVLMSYPQVRNILWDRFGIHEENFLGTGLSKPSGGSNNYGTASLHEYLIKNHFADSKDIWMRKLDPINHSDDLRMTVSQLFGKESMSPTEKEIVQRVMDKNTSVPVVIRFARFNSVDFSRQLGPKNRRYVFASNLAEVWSKSVTDAANLSGYISPKGDTVYIWVYLPTHANDVVPATWDQVLKLLRENDKD